MKTLKHNKMVIGLIALIITMGFGSATFAQGVASTPVSESGITPYIIYGENSGGNRTCAEVGLAFFGDADYYEFSSERVIMMMEHLIRNFPWV